MNILIDGNKIESDRIKGQNLEDILLDLNENHVPRNRVIGEVLLNGTSYSEDMPHAAVEIERADISSLELITRSAEELALHFIKNGDQILDAMMDSLPKIVEMFRLGDEAEANEHYLRFLDVLYLLVSMLEKVSGAMSIKFDNPIGDLGTLDDRLQGLAGITTQLVRIQEQNDWIYLADILEYELTPELEVLKSMLPDIKGRTH